MKATGRALFLREANDAQVVAPAMLDHCDDLNGEVDFLDIKD